MPATGATSAVGLACARLLVEQGAAVILVDDDADLVQEAASKIGGTAVVGDPASEETAEEADRRVMIRTGRLDVLIHCDMLQRRLALEDTDMQEWDSIMSVNLRGAFSFARVAHARDDRIRQRRDRLRHASRWDVPGPAGRRRLRGVDSGGARPHPRRSRAPAALTAFAPMPS